jgi:hypothetical protein
MLSSRSIGLGHHPLVQARHSATASKSLAWSRVSSSISPARFAWWGRSWMAMTWYDVKSKTADGSLNLVLCYQPRQVFENAEDQRKMARGMG